MTERVAVRDAAKGNVIINTTSCIICGTAFKAHGRAVTCGPRCSRERDKVSRKARRDAARANTYARRICISCGAEYQPVRAAQTRCRKYCGGKYGAVAKVAKPSTYDDDSKPVVIPSEYRFGKTQTFTDAEFWAALEEQRQRLIREGKPLTWHVPVTRGTGTQSPEPQTCPECGIEVVFGLRRPGAVYCSESCYLASRDRRAA